MHLSLPLQINVLIVRCFNLLPWLDMMLTTRYCDFQKSFKYILDYKYFRP